MTTSASTLYCGHCGAANQPGTGFCGRCGTALKQAAGSLSGGVRCVRCGAANSTSARFCGACAQPLAAAAAVAPVAPAGAPPAMPAYVPASQAQYAAATPSKTAKPVPWLLVGGGALLAMIILGGITLALRSGPVKTNCPPNCTEPPAKARPLAPAHTYTSSAYGYSLEYYDLAPKSSDDKSVSWAIKFKSSPLVSPVTFSGEPQKGRTAQQVVDEIQRGKYPDAKLLYSIPAAEMGYTDGYGNVYSMLVSPGTGESLEARLIIIAAVKKNLVVDLVGIGPFRPTTPKVDGSHPNPAQTSIVDFFDDLVNTVVWPGDPPL